MEKTTSRRMLVWAPWAVLAFAAVVGIYARISLYGQSVLADELSTLFIVKGNGLGGTIDFVRGDGEISPPFYFVLAWLATKLGSAPELIRLPSVLAAVAVMPVFYLIGRRLFNERVGILATAIALLSPILIYNGATGRAYSVAFLCILISTLSLLYAIDTGRTRWWVAYAVATALAMYSHYTSAFVLIGQGLWALAYFPGARKGVVLANLGALLLFLPWLPGYLADSDSPTTPILEALQGYGFDAKKMALEQVLFWQVTVQRWTIMNRWDVLLLSLGVGLAALVALIGVIRGAGIINWLKKLDPAVVLVVILVLITPVGALLLGQVSTDVFGTRNLATIWVGLPFAIGALLVASGRYWGTAATLLVVAGLSIGALGLTDTNKVELSSRQTAEYIEDRIQPGDSVVSTTHLTPVPLTPLQAYLDPDIPLYQLGQPVSDPPFLPGQLVIPEPAVQLKKAFAGSGDIFVVSIEGENYITDESLIWVDGRTFDVPPNWRVESQERINGILPYTVTRLARTDSGQNPGDQ